MTQRELSHLCLKKDFYVDTFILTQTHLRKDWNEEHATIICINLMKRVGII